MAGDPTKPRFYLKAEPGRDYMDIVDRDGPTCLGYDGMPVVRVVLTLAGDVMAAMEEAAARGQIRLPGQ